MKPIGVVAALPAEARAFAGHAVARDTVVMLSSQRMICCCGMGGVRARAAARRLLAMGARSLVSWGVAGALEPTLQTGDLVIALKVVRLGSDPLPLSASWRDRVLVGLLAAHVQVFPTIIAEAPSPLLNAAQKRQARANLGAAAIDMESMAIAEVAHAAGVKCLVVRVIVDGYKQDLPAAITESNAFGDVHLLRFLGALLRNPKDVWKLLCLAKRFAIACAALRRVAEIPL